MSDIAHDEEIDSITKKYASVLVWALLPIGGTLGLIFGPLFTPPSSNYDGGILPESLAWGMIGGLLGGIAATLLTWRFFKMKEVDPNALEPDLESYG